MAEYKDIFGWFDEVRGRPVPKFVTGLRGTGKGDILLRLRERLLSEGVPEANTLYIDTDAPEIRRMATQEQVLDHIAGLLPPNGLSYVFIREAAALPDAEAVIGALASSRFREIFATSSSRSLLDRVLANCFPTRLALLEVLPEDSGAPVSASLARARRNEIFLNDVLAPNRILEVSIGGRVAGCLSDNLGDPLSLRSIAAAVSPARRLLSPHTIESYLASLVDAHLVEKVLRWDAAEECVQKTGYRYFFTDPELRLARFGAAPGNDERRMAMNRSWLSLRRTTDEVYMASGLPQIDFVSRTGKKRAAWRLDADGTLSEKIFRNRPPPGGDGLCPR